MKPLIAPDSDLHIHTRYSDGRAGVRDVIESAVARGFRRIAITDHMPLPFENRYAMAMEELDLYREEIRRVRKDYADVIDVRMGLEMEYLPGFEAWTENIAAKGWEHTIGSVHGILVDGRHGMVNGMRTEFERLLAALFNGDIRGLCTHYYKHLHRVVDSGLFTTVGHLDVLKKHNQDGIFFDETAAWYCGLVMETLDHIEASSMTVEINMSGRDHPTAAPYPSPWIVAECIHRDIPLVLSSDAHRPENIGRNFEMLPDMLCLAGADWGRCPSSEWKIPPESSFPY